MAVVMWTRDQLDDGCLDALAMVEAFTRGDLDGLGAVFQAQDGQDGTPLVMGLLTLVDRVLAETGTDPGEWTARIRQAMTGP
jgi:hypothetical protein